jgi:hypothetical protein
MNDNGWHEAVAAHRRWRRIAAAFFHAPQPPSSSQTEAFVRRVMARVEPQPAAVFPWQALLGARWLVPALSLSLAMLLFKVMSPGLEAGAPLDTLLLLEGSDRGMAEMVLPPDPAARETFMPSADDR